MSDATVRVKPLGDQWQTLGTGRHAGIWPEGLTLSADQWGPSRAAFTLRRRPGALFPDLLARTPVEIEIAGVTVWSGRTTDTPETEGDAPAINAQCEGWQYHLDDDAIERGYVHTRLSDWRDTRSLLATDLTVYKASGTVESSGAIVIGWANNAQADAGQQVGVTLDLGPANTAKRIVIDTEAIGGHAFATFKVRGHDTAAGSVGASGNEDPVTVAFESLTDGLRAGTFATARRYISIFLYRDDGASSVVAADRLVRLKSIKVFTDTAYESGNASVLKASQVVTDAITRAATRLSGDLSGIAATALAFPDFWPEGPRTPRELIAAANSPHNWLAKIDERKRVIFRARPSAPIIEIGEWQGADFSNASSNSDEEIVTKVIVRGQGPDSAPMSVTRTQTGTIIDRQGDIATKTLDAGFALETTFAQALGDTYLLAHRTSPLKGQATMSPLGARHVLGGGPVHPAHLLAMTGELVRLAHRTDPDTGAHTRTGTIAAVTYQHDQQAAGVDIDNTRGDFEALQARLGLVVPA